CMAGNAAGASAARGTGSRPGAARWQRPRGTSAGAGADRRRGTGHGRPGRARAGRPPSGSGASGDAAGGSAGGLRAERQGATPCTIFDQK
ncbi:hypothetical protein ABTG55_19465, partial [Acinetobacter baumannii]